MLKNQVRLVFFGEVQGVGFRSAARRIANEFSIKGFARNCTDGCVEVVAQADPETIDIFIKRLEEIFSIEKITKKREPVSFVFSDFSIL